MYYLAMGGIMYMIKQCGTVTKHKESIKITNDFSYSFLVKVII